MAAGVPISAAGRNRLCFAVCIVQNKLCDCAEFGACIIRPECSGITRILTVIRSVPAFGEFDSDRCGIVEKIPAEYIRHVICLIIDIRVVISPTGGKNDTLAIQIGQFLSLNIGAVIAHRRDVEVCFLYSHPTDFRFIPEKGYITSLL